MVKYAPKASKFNPVERGWSPLTFKVSNVILDPEQKIIKQGCSSTTPAAERIDQAFFKECRGVIKEIFTGYEFDQYAWKFGCVDPETQKVDLDGVVWDPQYSDQKDLQNFYHKKHSTRNRPCFTSEKEREYFKFSKYLQQHVEVCNHSISFQRCDSKKCGPCVKKHSEFPVPKEFFKNLGLPTLKANNTQFFVPEHQDENSNHFKTYLKMKEILQNDPSHQFSRDSDLVEKGHSECTEGCSISFKSEASHDRHNRLFHFKEKKKGLEKPGEGDAEQTSLKWKKCPICGELFETLWYLKVHKKKVGHFKEGETRGRKRKETAV